MPIVPACLHFSLQLFAKSLLSSASTGLLEYWKRVPRRIHITNNHSLPTSVEAYTLVKNMRQAQLKAVCGNKELERLG